MRVHIQNVPFEGIGSIADWLEHHRADVSTTRFFAGDSADQAGATDLLIIMGGPMSVHDEKAYSWLTLEKRAISNAMERGIPILGICLGAQLIADVCGARVYPNREKEIGWWPIHPIPNTSGQQTFTLNASTVFHWHGETFDLPSGAVHLASSTACRHQAFELPNRVIGLQFHLETTPESAAELIDHARYEISDKPYIQDEETLRQTPVHFYQVIHAEMNRLLDYLTP